MKKMAEDREDMMNQRWMTAVIIGTLAFSPLARLRADENGRGDPDSRPAYPEMKGGHNRLGLTDEQKTKMEAIKEAEQAAEKPLHRKDRDLTAKLKDQLEDKAGDADIKTTLAAIRTNREALMDQMKKFRAEREAILTPTRSEERRVGK